MYCGVLHSAIAWNQYDHAGSHMVSDKHGCLRMVKFASVGLRDAIQIRKSTLRVPPVLAGSARFGFFLSFFCRFLPVLGQHSAGFGRSSLGSVSFSLVCSGFRASLENRLHTI